MTEPLPTPRYEHTATLLADGRVLIVGGRGPTGNDLNSARAEYLASVEIFDPVTERWTAADPMRDARTGHTATALADGRVLVVGGHAADGNKYRAVRSVELYDPQSNSWTTLDSPLQDRYSSSATLLEDGRVLLITSVPFVSWSSDHTNRQRAVLLETDTFTWSDGPATADIVGGHAAVALEDGSVLAAGGAIVVGDGPPPNVALAAVFEPEAMRWRAVAPMHDERWMFAMARLADGRVMAFGGPRPEIYDPKDETWTLTEPPRSPRRTPALVALGDGRAFAVGEHGTIDSRPVAELYDPTTKSWSDAGPFPITEALSATRLLDGRVLIAGGSLVCYFGTGCEDNAVTADAYLFDPAVLP